MAPKQKRPSPLNNPPPIESEEDQEPSHENQEEDDDVDDDDGETASSDEQEGDDEQQKYHLSRAVQPAPKSPSLSQPHSSSSDSESESATESDSDSEPETHNPTPTPNSKVKPLASKPKEQAPKSKQTQSSSSAATQAKSASKRAAENNVRSPDPKHAKKKKKVEADDAPASEDNEEAKKSSHDDSKRMFQRVFSEEDELAVLEGVVEFRSVTGDDPYKCPDAFHDFMKRSKRLSFNASSLQLKEKIRRLKTKFNNNARRGKNGEAPKFSKPHEQRAFELSQAIWGEDAGGGGGVNNGALEKAKPDDGKVGKKITNPKKDSENAEKLKVKPEPAKAKLDSELQLPPDDSKELGKVDEITEGSAGLGSMIRYDKGLGEHGLGEYFLRKGDALMEGSKRTEFEGKWAKLEAAQSELHVKRAELYANHAKSMLHAIKSVKNRE